uniref:L-asparaginase N-terminal domain-containing protein n=1 Tax=Plectus sambesii TaxID=2011161 RepID=A0A914WG00_9BILA
MHRILAIQTGGTIDKCYPRSIGGYAFEIGAPVFEKVFARCRVNLADIRAISVCKKDSQDIDETDRHELANECLRAEENRILISHGTDTILETAEYLADRVEATEGKVIVLTGSFLPESFKDSDADFNFGMAFATLQLTPLDQAGVYVAVDGCIALWNQMNRDLQSGKFHIVTR